jgi:hypothetical protein
VCEKKHNEQILLGIAERLPYAKKNAISIIPL